jgi:hypothetical protein
MPEVLQESSPLPAVLQTEFFLVIPCMDCDIEAYLIL